MTFKELTNEYYEAQSAVRNLEPILKNSVMRYLEKWTDCDTSKIAEISYGPFPEVFVIYTYDKFHKFKTYEIPYDDIIPEEEDNEL